MIAARSRAAVASFLAGPAYPASAEDRRTVRILGLDLPLRATTAVLVVTLVVLIDYTRSAIPEEVQAIGRAAAALRYQAIERVILFGIAPLLIVTWAFRDRPAAYGVRIGDWRWGLTLAVAGGLVMTPIVLAVNADPAFRSWYALSSAPLGDLVVTHVLDLAPSEFLFRGFLMFTLLRAIGPLGLVVAQLPFIFAHLNKPELEVYSTLLGGLAYGWLAWRTGSILWGMLAHVYILTLALALAGAT